MSDVIIHATTVALGEAGVIVRGSSGSGKTTLAFALVAHWQARARFALFVADDRTRLVPRGGRVIASAPEAIAARAELRGAGIVALTALPAVRLSLVVDLVPPADAPRMPDDADSATELAGVRLQRLVLPARTTVASTLVVASLLEQNGLTGASAETHAHAPGNNRPRGRTDT